VGVEFDPQAVREGKDPQLEKAVALVLEESKKYPRAVLKRPPSPNYTQPGLKEPAEGKGGEVGGNTGGMEGWAGCVSDL
jgi:tricorn protease